MIANRMKPVLAALACLVLVSAADAGERRHVPDRHHAKHGRASAGSTFAGNTFSGDHRRHWVGNTRFDRQGDRFASRHYAGNGWQDWSVRRLRGDRGDWSGTGSTWAGATYAYPDDGNGIYFDRGYGAGEMTASADRIPGPKIIRVDRNDLGGGFAARNACSYEEGVCVIRGGR